MTPDEAPDHPGIASRVARFAAVAGVFAGLGPLVGLVAFAGGIGAASLVAEKPADWGAVAAFVMIYGVVFAHFFAVVPALVSGAAVAAIAAWRGREVPVAAGAILSGAIGAIYFHAIMHGRGSAAIETWKLVAMYGGASLVAGGVCTSMTRRLQG